MALRAISSRPDNYGRREQSPFATSPAYDLLFHELTRYLANEIRGRSFLIAGHRGSGKTTLVLRAIEDLQGYWQEELVGSGSRTTTSLQRPLLVKLHGPNLLRGLALDHRTDASDKNKKQEQVDREQDLTQKILVQIIISLYRALSAEVSRCYLAHIRHNPPRGASPELAGQLSLELDNAPDPAVLREFWTRVKALGGGVLFYDVSPPFGQGTLELVAISTAAQAYRVVSGAVTYKSSESGAAETDKSLSTEAKPQFKDLGQNILSLLTGGLFGAAYLSHRSDPDPLIAAGLGLATALVTSWAFTFTSRRTRKSSISKEHTFIRDSSVSTLDRELPVVIQRIRDAGLAPVFVVDELDKIDDLEKAMEKLILRLKHLVADFSFFCFLTDRDYYEYLRDLSVRLPYPRAHTYFSHRIFVHYRPSDLHTYLNQVLESARKDKEKEEASDEEDRISRCALSYLLLHRARMHTFDLQRELSKICDDRGWITLSPSALVSHLGFRFNVAAQLAIEHLLNEDELRDRVEQDPHFGQLAYDALYYVSRSWAAGESELDISEEKIDQYLTTRLWHKEVEEADLGRQTTNGHAEITSPVSSRLQDRALSPIDRRFLLDRVERIVEFLVTPTVLVDKLLVKLSEVGDTSLENNTIIRTIPTDRNTPLLTVIGHNRYRWCRDIYGRLLHGEAGRRISFEIQKKASEFIDEFVKSLRRSWVRASVLSI